MLKLTIQSRYQKLSSIHQSILSMINYIPGLRQATIVLSILVAVLFTAPTTVPFPFAPTANKEGIVVTKPKNSIYVPGSGASGLWYAYGQLQQLKEDLQSKEFYCYSSGCFASVAALNNIPIEEFLDSANDARDPYMVGEITMHECIDNYLDNLVYATHKSKQNTTTYNNNNNNNNSYLSTGEESLKVKEKDYSSIRQLWGDDESVLKDKLKRLHIITAVYDSSSLLSGGGLIKTVVRTPNNLQELREMLRQTSWIPFATGNNWSYKGHLDGAFGMSNHPKCETNVVIPYNYFMASNSLNLNMPRADALRLWDMGYNTSN